MTRRNVLTSGHPLGNLQRQTVRNLRRGFNLVELLIALAITAALLAAVMVALQASFVAYQTTTEVASTHTISRLIMSRMLTMIRTGSEFGPFPVDPLETLITSDEMQFMMPEGEIVTLTWRETADEPNGFPKPKRCTSPSTMG